jgi:hypothetical protein
MNVLKANRANGLNTPNLRTREALKARKAAQLALKAVAAAVAVAGRGGVVTDKAPPKDVASKARQVPRRSLGGNVSLEAEKCGREGNPLWIPSKT